MKSPKQNTIAISAIVGAGICVSASDGQKVYKKIHDEIESKNRVALSFSGVTRMTTAFLNAAVGQLYGEYSEEDIRKYLAPPTDYEEWHLARLKMVVDRAKMYFKDPVSVEKIYRDPRNSSDG